MAVEMRLFGRTGVQVSNLCLGAMMFGMRTEPDDAYAMVDRAIERGVNFIDTANVYSRGRSETITGEALKRNGKRDRVVLATKFHGAMADDDPNMQGASRRHIVAACEASLQRLQTDYIDLYQMHRPRSDTAIDETLRALDDLVRQGKVRYIGCSNFQAWMLAKALWTSDKNGLTRFDCVQPRYNILFREIEHELLPLCRDQGVGVIPYNPLAGGFLTGKHMDNQASQNPSSETRFALEGRAGRTYKKRYWQEAQFAAVSHLHEFFSARNKPLAQVAIAWVLAQDGITSPIVGATSPEQLRQSLPAVDLSLDEEEMAVCDAVWFELPRLKDPMVALR